MVLLESNNNSKNKSKYVKKIKCPYCEKRLSRKDLIYHVDSKHSDLIPENYTATRVVFNTINHKERGSCIICGRETAWDESKGRYDRICERAKCHEDYLIQVRSRMYNKYGTTNLITDERFAEEQQKKMLANRRISGKYVFQNGDVKTYTGSYEKKCLEFMDTVLNCKAEDILAPGPTIEYTLNGVNHLYISDIYYVPYNLIIEIKDGGDNPNTRDMSEYRAKQIAKEKSIIDSGKYNYLRLTNNNFAQLLEIFAELKFQLIEGNADPVININESLFFKKDKLSDEEFKKIVNICLSKTKNLSKKYENDVKIKKEIRENIDKGVKELEDDGYEKNEIEEEYGKYAYSKNIPKSKVEIFEESKKINEFIFSIDDNLSQELRISIFPLLKKISEELKNDEEIKKYIYSIGTGNGDEACLYFKIKNVINENMSIVGFMPPQGIDDVYVINHGKKDMFGNFDKLAVTRYKDLSNTITLDDLGNLVTLPDDYFNKNECKIYKVPNGIDNYMKILEDYLHNNSNHLRSYIYETMTGKKLLSMTQLETTMIRYEREVDLAKLIAENVYYSIVSENKPFWRSIEDSSYLNYDVYVDENGYFFMNNNSHRTPSFDTYEELCTEGAKYVNAIMEEEAIWTI